LHVSATPVDTLVNPPLKGVFPLDFEFARSMVEQSLPHGAPGLHRIGETFIPQSGHGEHSDRRDVLGIGDRQ